MAKEKQEKVKKEKKPLSKKAKIWIALGTAFVFVVACAGTLLAVLLSPKIKLHGLAIANYESYKGIGAASFGETAENVAYAASEGSGKKDMKLAGITKENQCREIEFENDKGKIVKQNTRLIHFDAYDKFTLFTLTTNKKHNYVEENEIFNSFYRYEIGKHFIAINQTSFSYKDTRLLILDNETGKIYDMKEIIDSIEDMLKHENFGVYFLNIPNNEGVSFYNVQPVGQDNLLFKVVDFTNYDGNYNVSIIQVKLCEKSIEISERMNAMQFNNATNRDNFDSYGSMSIIMQDIYGNIFFKQTTYPGNIDKYQKVNKEFVELDTSATYIMGINSIMYKQQDSKTFYMNAKGEFEEINFDTQIISNENKFHYQNGNVIFAGNNNNKDYKITLDEEFDWKYTLEEFSFSTNNNTVAQGDFLYSFNAQTNVITKFDTRTSVSDNISSQYTFKNLNYNKNLDRVVFKAVDNSTMLEVDGYFDSKGVIHIGDFNSINYGNNKVYIVKPVN